MEEITGPLMFTSNIISELQTAASENSDRYNGIVLNSDCLLSKFLCQALH